MSALTSDKDTSHTGWGPLAWHLLALFTSRICCAVDVVPQGFMSRMLGPQFGNVKKCWDPWGGSGRFLGTGSKELRPWVPSPAQGIRGEKEKKKEEEKKEIKERNRLLETCSKKIILNTTCNTYSNPNYYKMYTNVFTIVTIVLL
jgi:hypothetical protein